MSSKFITVEGIEGAGKSTALNVMRTWLEKKNIDHVMTREPGGTEIAESIRQTLLTPHDEKMHADTELLLMFAGRAQHIHHVIEPALSAGKWVVSDRFTDASYAYQGAGRTLPEERIAVLEDWVQGQLQPDLTLLLDVPVKVGIERINSREKDRIEQEKEAFFNRVRDAYLARAKQFPERIKVIDASQTEEKVHQDIEAVINGLI